MAAPGSSAWRSTFWPACEKAKLKTDKFGPQGIRLTVAKVAVEAVNALFNCMAAHGYTVRQKDTGAYNCRVITNGTVPSAHASGIAVDVNWNCVDGRTRIVTEDGVREIGDLPESRLLTRSPVLGMASRYVMAPIASFGDAPVRRVVLSRRGIETEVLTTDNHRWFAYEAKDQARRHVRVAERTTVALRAGDSLAGCLPPSVAKRTNLSPIGVIAGLTFGDGTKGKSAANVSIFGREDIDALSGFLTGLPSHSRRTARGVPGVCFSGLPRFFKDAPPLDAGASYLLGWIAGYFAADGTVSQYGQPLLTSRVASSVEAFVAVAARVGIACGTPRKYRDELGVAYRLSLVRATCPDEMFLKPKHRARFTQVVMRKDRYAFKVERVESVRGKREVFCPSVPGTGAFALEGWVLTGNSNPYVKGKLVTDMPRPMIDAILQIQTRGGVKVWRWGGDWDGRPETPHAFYDAMHFEVIATPDELKAGIDVDAPVVTPGRLPVLKKGAVGPAVVKLQELLQRGGYPVASSGQFLKLTDAAVRAYQTSRGLKSDGVVGPATWTALVNDLPALASGDMKPNKSGTVG